MWDLDAEAERLNLKLDDLSSFWSNQAGKVLLVTALTNLGSMLGAWAAPLILLGGLGLG